MFFLFAVNFEIFSLRATILINLNLNWPCVVEKICHIAVATQPVHRLQIRRIVHN